MAIREFVFRDREGRVIELDRLTIEELRSLRFEAMDAIASIEIQVMGAKLEAQEGGKPLDKAWATRAKQCQLIQQRLVDYVDRQIEKLNVLGKTDNVYQAFYLSATEVLPAEMFGRVRERANEMIIKEEGQQCK